MTDQVSTGQAITDQAFLVGFNRAVELVEMPTASRVQLDTGLERLEVPADGAGNLQPRAEGTALFDAIRGAASVFRRESGRKALVVISDGVDTASGIDVDDAVEAALRADAIVYPIRVFDQDVFRFNIRGAALDNLRRGERALREIAERTGGRVFDIAGETSLEDGFAGLDQELRSQYSLGFTPGADVRPGEFRRLRVRVNRNGLTVNARDGYYAADR